MQDEVEQSIFGRIARGEVPVETIYEDEHVLAFRDINPQAPVHVIVIPRARAMRNVLDLTEADAVAAGRLLLAAAEVARRLGIAETGARIVLNAGNDAGQTVPYLHAHVLGGRALGELVGR